MCEYRLGPACAAGANCVVIEKCTEATRKKLKILDSDPSYKVNAKLETGCFEWSFLEFVANEAPRVRNAKA